MSPASTRHARRSSLEIELRHGGVEVAAEGWDLVVSNPPYVQHDELTQPELRWEPRAALIEAGLHEQIARAAATRWIVVEVGDEQADAVADMLERVGYTQVATTRDLNGIKRVVEGTR